MSIVRRYSQIPRGEVHWREAVWLAALCLDGANVAAQIRQNSGDRCTKGEYWAVFRLLYSRPVGSPWCDKDGIPYCECRMPVYHRAPLLRPQDLAVLRPASGDWQRHSAGDLGFVEEPAGCVGAWLDMWSGYRPPPKRPEWKGRPTDWDLRGRLFGLVRRIERAREAVGEARVVSPTSCAALLLFFTEEALEAEFPLPKVELLREGVASGASLRKLREEIERKIRSR
jgi:hypothetical protein